MTYYAQMTQDLESIAFPVRNCLRCVETPLSRLPESDAVSTFYLCTRCKRQYELKPDRSLSYRWRHPISLALYGVIFNPHPVGEAQRVAQSLMRAYSSAHVKVFAKEIELELTSPTQQVRDILENVASEEECREFLREVLKYLPRPDSEPKFAGRLLRFFRKSKD